ncbi:MAG: hypothetical protein H7222_01555 [Methylotenera sp.]|nr:hypothetical protein [Oligoflexia bacterium]
MKIFLNRAASPLIALTAVIAIAIASAVLCTEASAAEPKSSVGELCASISKTIAPFKWNMDPCQGVDWSVHGSSVQGRPLVYTEFGDPQSKNVTLVFAMVHPDEITPLYMGIQLIRYLQGHPADLKDARVIIAPLVNPDGFFVNPKIRMNSRGVDVNRNFATHDWKTNALRAWKVRYKSNARRFPGHEPASEPETRFQVQLIQKFQPRKILSIHSPLNHMDYDGPSSLSLDKFPKDYIQECLKLRTQLNAVSTGFFPGSLGNYAGQELGIPTVTLELPTANAAKASEYWIKFQSGIHSMIDFKIEPLSPRHDLAIGLQ